MPAQQQNHYAPCVQVYFCKRFLDDVFCLLLATHNALSLAQKFYNAGKITAAICIAPVILANAGLLNGKKATSFPSEENALEDKGAAFTGNPVEADGLIVTAEGPKAARDFGKKIAQLLK